MNVNHLLSHAGKSMKRSAIREILKQVQKPGMISFAGGLPAPETFPVEDLKRITLEVLEKSGPASLQYGITEGDPVLRRILVDRYNKQGLNINLENLIITTGSQQGLDLIAKILIDRGDHVLCSLPSYLGGLNAFLSYGAKLKGIPIDESGMKPDVLEKAIIRLKKNGNKIKLIYLIPDFQNPAGITMPESRRLKIIELAAEYDLLIVEDSPYRELRFEGEHQRLMSELDTSGRVLTLGTFSKIFAPGLRVGWIVGHQQILEKIIIAKQTSDICTSSFAQKIIALYLRRGLLGKNLPATIELYRQRRSMMTACLSKYMHEDVKWTEPQGGLFLFVTLPEHIDADLVLARAIEENVAFVSGATFFCDNSGHNTMRLNFSYSDNFQIDTGIQRLAGVINKIMTASKTDLYDMQINKA